VAPPATWDEIRKVYPPPPLLLPPWAKITQQMEIFLTSENNLVCVIKVYTLAKGSLVEEKRK